MAISTKAELRTAVLDWLARSGSSALTARADDFLVLLESRLNRWQPPLRVTEVDTTLTGTVGSRQLALPSDFSEAISLHRTTDGTETLMTPFVVGTIPYGTANGTPAAWGINGANIDLDVPEAQADTFRLRYRQKLALAAANDDDTNWLLTNHPDVYLFGMLVEAGAYMKTGGQAAMWKARFEEAMAEVSAQQGRAKAIAPLMVDPMLSAVGRRGTYNIVTDV